MEGKNKLYFGDNLSILRDYVEDATVDLIYLDPPFDSSATYYGAFVAPPFRAALAGLKPGATKSSGNASYAWDFENRLSSATVNGATTSFKYDPFGRRVYKSSSAGTTVYVYDGDNLIEELGAGGLLRKEYTAGPGIDEPLAELRSGNTNFYEADGLGSVTSLTNAAGAIANTYTYDSFGKLTASSGSVVNPLQFTAREFDSETGLYYYRARYYDPTLGRFLSEDASLFEGGINFYGYVENGPVNWLDPFGLRRQKVRGRPKARVDPCPKEKRCFFNWLNGPLSKVAQDLDTTKALMFTMAAAEGGWTPGALAHNMPLNNPFGVNKISHGEAVGNIAYPSLSAAIDYWERTYGNRVQGDKDPAEFVDDLQNPEPPGKPYNTANSDYEGDFERVFQAVKRFMKLCGINP